MLLPMVFLAGSLANGADRLIDFAKPYVEQGLPTDPPAWLSGLPFVGREIDNFWHQVAGSHLCVETLACLGAFLGHVDGPCDATGADEVRHCAGC